MPAPPRQPSFVSYVGTSGSDSAANVVVNDDEIYVAGATNGALNGGTAPKASNSYVAKLDDTGAQVWVHQYAGSAGAGAARAIAIDPQGSSVLDTLGLPRKLTLDQSRAITTQSTVRPGDYFYHQGQRARCAQDHDQGGRHDALAGDAHHRNAGAQRHGDGHLRHRRATS